MLMFHVVWSAHAFTGKVCLGFPISTLAGLRGQAGDPLLELKTPVLFVVRRSQILTHPGGISLS